ncbi:MAG TPA: sigma-70 family RNA polymerase sigma factor [Candidatus Lumbricidophila sp.]|nr:sigma-70 family RNA polymerase sigma factor [Candidatus Lumbricidophila sp.]
MAKPTGLEGLSDSALTTRVGHREHGAFDVLYRRYARPVAWTARSLLSSAIAAEDATQSTFVVFWKKAARITLEGDSLLPWLIGVCRLECRTILAKGAVLARATPIDGIELASSELGPEAVAEQNEWVQAANQEVARMSEIDQQIYRLCVLKELSYELAARELGVTHGVIRNRLSRLRARLRRTITPAEMEVTQ